MTNGKTTSIDPYELQGAERYDKRLGDFLNRMPHVVWERRVNFGRWSLLVQRWDTSREFAVWISSWPEERAGPSVFFEQTPLLLGFVKADTHGELWVGKWYVTIEKMEVTP